MENAKGYKHLNFEHIVMLRNERNLDTIRKVVSLQANMQLNTEQYNSGLIDSETYTKNISTTQEALMKILTDAKKDLDYLACVEKEQYETLLKR